MPDAGWAVRDVTVRELPWPSSEDDARTCTVATWERRGETRCLRVTGGPLLRDGACGAVASGVVGDAGVFHLQSVWVPESCRRRHVGTRLVVRVAIECARHGLVRLEVDDMSGTDFYRKLRFRPHAPPFPECSVTPAAVIRAGRRVLGTVFELA